MLRELGIHGAALVGTYIARVYTVVSPNQMLFARHGPRVKAVSVLPFAFAAEGQVVPVDADVDFAAEVVECHRGR